MYCTAVDYEKVRGNASLFRAGKDKPLLPTCTAEYRVHVYTECTRRRIICSGGYCTFELLLRILNGLRM